MQGPCRRSQHAVEGIGSDCVGFFSVLARLQDIYEFRKLGCVLDLRIQFFQCDAQFFMSFPKGLILMFALGDVANDCL